MKITAWGNNSGSKYWRLIDPFKYLNRNGLNAEVSDDSINEISAKDADVYVLQSCTDKNGIALLFQYQKEKGKKLVVECDDYFELNEDSPFKKEHEAFDAKFVITRTMEVADMITTTTKYLAGRLREYNDNVVVLPNYMDMERWDLTKMNNESGSIRIGWAGSITHLEDMRMVVEPLKKIHKEFPQTTLIIIGDPRVGELFKFMPVEAMQGVPFDVWPTKLHSLRLDIGLAPLRDTVFNRCKSNIKWLEYAIAKIPGVFSPTVYERAFTHLKFDGNLGMVAYDEEQWYRCIKNYIVSSNLRNDIASRAYSVAWSWYSLEKNIQEWLDAYVSLT